MNRFLAYAGVCYYASAALGDLMGSFDTKEEAIEAMLAGMDPKRGTDPWGCVFDQKHNEYVCGAGRVSYHDDQYEPNEKRPFPHVYAEDLEIIPWNEKP